MKSYKVRGAAVCNNAAELAVLTCQFMRNEREGSHCKKDETFVQHLSAKRWVLHLQYALPVPMRKRKENFLHGFHFKTGLLCILLLLHVNSRLPGQLRQLLLSNLWPRHHASISAPSTTRPPVFFWRASPAVLPAASRVARTSECDLGTRQSVFLRALSSRSKLLQNGTNPSNTSTKSPADRPNLAIFFLFFCERGRLLQQADREHAGIFSMRFDSALLEMTA